MYRYMTKTSNKKQLQKQCKKQLFVVNNYSDWLIPSKQAYTVKLYKITYKYEYMQKMYPLALHFCCMDAATIRFAVNF